MWRVWLSAGALVWIATIAASGAINYAAGYAFGRSEFEAQIFSVLGVAADAWKAVGPIFILVLWRRGRYFSATLAVIVWTTCFAVAVSSALGLAAQNRSAVTGSREVTKLSYQSALEEFEDHKLRRNGIQEFRTPEEIERAITVALVAPVAGRGTVASLSENCGKDHPRARDACAEIARLRQALAQATEAHRVDRRLDDIRQRVANLRERGGTLEPDPQAQLISRLSLGWLPVADVGLVLVLLLVTMIELISAFAPVVLHEYAGAVHPATAALHEHGAARSGEDGAERIPADPAAQIMEYLVSKLMPDPTGEVSLPALMIDFTEWCAQRQLRPPSLSRFVSELNAICDSELGGVIRREGHSYLGCRLEAPDPQASNCGARSLA